MNPAEALERIVDLPGEVVGYMLMTYALLHPSDFEKSYLEGTLKHAR